ncbi:MAG: hypothetical protein J5X22_13745 [Candidatus Accumulibacter sp.]|uniref:Uncharacterized protein n=2 Tax=Candidatus Accumulibacter TaxID=327159 RepID=A0A080MHF9_9PROT|nr:hypothetical protein [Accumulibacter sp.]KFB76664.1 MAG: hypothetical protein AW06_002234 [Candidatus Accumulibacter cognatus]MBN8518979.1 hypothetical protein [Accumulibacter sp.]MBO3711520.1 hypothetical protein [Accumulibacter sp.]
MWLEWNLLELELISSPKNVPANDDKLNISPMSLMGAAITAWLLVVPARADHAVGAASGLQIGDCVIFREGGAGWLLKTPTYWFKGLVVDLSRERRIANLCPHIGKQASAYTQADQLRLAAAMPCVDKESEVQEVPVLRLRVAVEAWETPWSPQHGGIGWLYRGQFLDQKLYKGGVLDIDATWLAPCETDT